MHVVRGSHFWQLGSVGSVATETKGGVILVSFWSKHVSEAISECLILKISMSFYNKLIDQQVVFHDTNFMLLLFQSLCAELLM